MKKELKKTGKVKSRKKAPKTAFTRKLRLITFYFSLLFIIVSIGIVLSLTVLFKIDKVDVDGDTRYDKNKIISECTIKKGENLLLADSKDCKEKVENEFPYIDEVCVNKCIPSKVVLKIKEAQVFGTIELENNKYAIISDSTKVLDIVDTPPEGFAIIKGTNIKDVELSQHLHLDNDYIKNEFLDITAALRKYDITNVTEIDLANGLNINLIYDGRIRIILGRNDDIDYKVQTANEIIKNKLNSTERGTLDLSVTSEDGHSYFMPEYVS